MQPNFALANPSQLSDIITDLLTQGIGNVPGQDQTIQSRLRLLALTTPAAPVVAPNTSGGATSWAYKIVALLGTGTTPASAATTLTTGQATLSSTVFNTITWTPVAGATGYQIWRTTAAGTPSTTGLIATVGAGVTSFNDTGLVGSSTTAPTLNSTVTFGGLLQDVVTVYGANGAITNFGHALITKSTAAAMTLGQPIAGSPAVGGHDGLKLTIVDTTGHAHTVTTPANGICGTGVTGSDDTATSGAAAQDTITLMAYNGLWVPISLGGWTLSEV